MTSITLAEIEKKINGLSSDEQLWLVEKLVQRLRKKTGREILEQELAAMAADPDIQREIKNINEEFAGTELDGLEGI